MHYHESMGLKSLRRQDQVRHARLVLEGNEADALRRVGRWRVIAGPAIRTRRPSAAASTSLEDRSTHAHHLATQLAHGMLAHRQPRFSVIGLEVLDQLHRRHGAGRGRRVVLPLAQRPSRTPCVLDLPQSLVAAGPLPQGVEPRDLHKHIELVFPESHASGELADRSELAS